MNVNLQYSIDFMGAIWYEGELKLNSYSVSLNLLTVSEHAMVTNVAMERIKAFVMAELSNVVFINQAHEAQSQLLEAIGANVCTLPEEPIDQIIGIMLYCKLNAVTEGQLLVTKLDISSALGDEVWYQHDEDDHMGPFAHPGWWHSKTCQKNNLVAEEVNENVLKVEPTGWTEYGLDWPEIKQSTGDKIVRPDFRKNENH